MARVLQAVRERDEAEFLETSGIARKPVKAKVKRKGKRKKRSKSAATHRRGVAKPLAAVPVARAPPDASVETTTTRPPRFTCVLERNGAAKCSGVRLEKEKTSSYAGMG